MGSRKHGTQGILMLRGMPELFPMFYHAQLKQTHTCDVERGE